MRRYQSLGDLPLGGPRRSIAIGTFDGVHLGHQEVIRRAVEIGSARGLQTMALTFDPNPIAVLRPALAPPVLTASPLKAQLISRLGPDELLVVPFNRAFSRIAATRFAEMLASAPIGADALVVGANFRYGHGGEGTSDTLEQFGRAHGLLVEVPEIVCSVDGKPVSSTRVRRLIATGHVEEVAELLGRPHALDGVVERGDGRGQGLGFPTANVALADDLAVPEQGVYAGRASLMGSHSSAAINVGTSPTFPGADRRGVRVEAFLLDHDGSDIYDQPIRVEFVARLRREKRFDSPEELIAQMHRDVEDTRRIAGKTGGGDAEDAAI